MEQKILKEEDLEIGKPVDWHIYDGKGRLLLKKGMALRTEGQIRKLISLESYAKIDEFSIIELKKVSISDELSPFHAIENVLSQLKRLFNEIVHQPADQKKQFVNRFTDLSKSIIDLCEYDLDATIGAIHIGQGYDYTIVHPLHCAILCYVLATSAEFEEEQIISITNAALTANLGMYELQKELTKQMTKLLPEQREEIDKHTMRSAVLLKRMGVADKLWLEIVLQHHEKQDGTGYPRKLAGKEFVPEARIVALADRYHAMVSPRNYREGLSPTEALKMIFQARGKEVDESLGAVLIKKMGIYPPGSIVKLASLETAIVTRRTENKMAPNVKSIVNPDARQYGRPRIRDSSHKKFKIIGLCPAPQNYRYNLASLWDYEIESSSDSGEK